MLVWAATLTLMGLLTTAAAQPTPVAVALWQHVGGGAVTNTTHVVGGWVLAVPRLRWRSG